MSHIEKTWVVLFQVNTETWSAETFLTGTSASTVFKTSWRMRSKFAGSRSAPTAAPSFTGSPPTRRFTSRSWSSDRGLWRGSPSLSGSLWWGSSGSRRRRPTSRTTRWPGSGTDSGPSTCPLLKTASGRWCQTTDTTPTRWKNDTSTLWKFQDFKRAQANLSLCSRNRIKEH